MIIIKMEKKVEEFYIYVDIPDNNMNKDSIQNKKEQNNVIEENYYVYANNPNNTIKKLYSK